MSEGRYHTTGYGRGKETALIAVPQNSKTNEEKNRCYHREYLEDPIARFCGGCGDRLSRPIPKVKGKYELLQTKLAPAYFEYQNNVNPPTD